MKPWLVLSWLVSVAAAGAIGYAAHKCEPAVQLHQDTASAKKSDKDLARHDAKGAEEEVRRTFRPPPRGCPAGTALVLASETTIKRGPSTSDTAVKSHSDEHAQQHVDLKVDLPRLPSWAIGAGVEDPLGSRRPHLELGRRVLGPVWLRAGVTPARGLAGVYLGLAVEF